MMLKPIVILFNAFSRRSDEAAELDSVLEHFGDDLAVIEFDELFIEYEADACKVDRGLEVPGLPSDWDTATPTARHRWYAESRLRRTLAQFEDTEDRACVVVRDADDAATVAAITGVLPIPPCEVAAEVLARR